MHTTRKLSWKSALLSGWIVGLAASAIAQPPYALGNETQASLLLAQLSLHPAEAAAPASLDTRLTQLEGWLDAAYFSEVAGAVSELRSSAHLVASSPRERARFEVIAGTAHLALGGASTAVSCFKRAVEAWPELELRASGTSPKVLRAFAAARRELGIASERAAVGASGARDLPARLIEGGEPLSPVPGGGLRPTILCRLLIDASGAVVSAAVQRPRAELARFEEIALASVRHYRFAPAQRDGQPVSSWLNWPVQF